MICNATGRDRQTVPPSAGGTLHAMCEGCERAAMSTFGERWHDEARAGVLRTSIVGGISITRTDSLSGADPVVPPVAAIGPRQAASSAPTAGGG